jgi:hypothetical protein
MEMPEKKQEGATAPSLYKPSGFVAHLWWTLASIYLRHGSFGIFIRLFADFHRDLDSFV